MQLPVTKIGLIAGPSLFFFSLLLGVPGQVSPAARIVFATALLMAVWWVTEAIPIFATSLIPLVAFPLGRVATAGKVSPAYMDQTIVLFMGGFFLAMAIQKCGLHRRIALAIISVLGVKLPFLVLGFMISSAFISMWVSNTATAIMMLPIATAVVIQLKEKGLSPASRFPPVLMLGVAYSASIGGVATLIGTPPNIVLVAQFSALFPHRPGITFGQWMLLGVPFALIFLVGAWFYLTHFHTHLKKEPLEVAADVIRQEVRELGPMRHAEKMVAAVFLSTALAWIFRGDLNLGFWRFPGWADLLGVADYVHDSTVAVIASLVLFVVPGDWRTGEALLDWSWAARIPWGILLLFGGGIALARGFQSSGLSLWIGEQLQLLRVLPVPLLVLSICLVVTFLTELTSNTATATLFMPILGATAMTLEISPELLMIPAAMSASCAFMLPVATPPNAIVFGSEEVTLSEMSRAGLWLNLMGAAIITLLIYTLAIPVFGIDS